MMAGIFAERSQTAASALGAGCVRPTLRTITQSALELARAPDGSQPLAEILAEHPRAEVVVARAADGAQQGQVERVLRLGWRQALPLGEPDRQQRRALRVLERLAQPHVGGER
jgi:hypothetical protein